MKHTKTPSGATKHWSTKKSPTSIDQHVGARVRMQRNLVGISQTELGRRSGGITFQQVQKYENGTNRIGASRLHLISQALGVPIAFFYEGGPDESPRSGRRASQSVVPDLSRLLATSDAVDLMKAFVRINDRALRRTIVALAQELAGRVKHASGRAATH
jgi:transcriptional regulator with XRE-family HTH domain